MNTIIKQRLICWFGQPPFGEVPHTPEPERDVVEDALRWIIEYLYPVIHYYVSRDRYGTRDADRITHDFVIKVLTRRILRCSQEMLNVKNWFAFMRYYIHFSILDDVRHYRREEKRSREFIDDHECVVENEDAAAVAEFAIDLEMAITDLPPRKRLVFNLVRDNLPVTKIARIMEINVKTVRTTLFYARQQLSKDPRIRKHLDPG